eukprot:gene1831-973_t
MNNKLQIDQDEEISFFWMPEEEWKKLNPGSVYPYESMTSATKGTMDFSEADKKKFNARTCIQNDKKKLDAGWSKEEITHFFQNIIQSTESLKAREQYKQALGIVFDK